MPDEQTIIQILAQANLAALDQTKAAVAGLATGQQQLASSGARATAQQGALGSAMQAMGGAARIATGVAGAAVGAFVTGGIAKFTDFDAHMREVWTLMPNMSETAFHEMEGQVRSFSKEFGVLPDEEIPALYQAISAGIPPDNVFSFLGAAEKSAVAGVADLKDSVQLLAGTLNAYHLQASEAARVSDAMFTAVRLGVTTYPELAAAMSNVTPLAAALNVQIEDLSAAIVTTTKQGTQTSQAITGIQGAMTAMVRSNPPMLKAIHDLGYENANAMIAALGFEGSLEALRKSADDASIPLPKLFGRVDAVRTVLQLTGPNATSAAADLAAFADTAGATDTAFAKMADSIKHQAQVLSASVYDMAVSIGEKLQALGPLVYLMGPTLSRALGGAFGFAFGTLGPLIVRYFIDSVVPPVVAQATATGVASGAAQAAGQIEGLVQAKMLEQLVAQEAQRRLALVAEAAATGQAMGEAQGAAQVEAATGQTMLRRMLVRLAAIQIPLAAEGTTIGTVVGGAMSAAIALASNPIGWGIAIVAGLTLLGGNADVRNAAVEIGRKIMGFIVDAAKSAIKGIVDLGGALVSEITSEIGDHWTELTGGVSDAMKKAVAAAKADLPNIAADYANAWTDSFQHAVEYAYHQPDMLETIAGMANPAAFITDQMQRDDLKQQLEHMDALLGAMKGWAQDHDTDFTELWTQVAGPNPQSIDDVQANWTQYLNDSIYREIVDWTNGNEARAQQIWMSLLQPDQTPAELAAAWSKYLTDAQINDVFATQFADAGGQAGSDAAKDLLLEFQNENVPAKIAAYLQAHGAELKDGAVKMTDAAGQELADFALKQGQLLGTGMPESIATYWANGGDAKLSIGIQAMLANIDLDPAQTQLADIYEKLNIPNQLALQWAQTGQFQLQDTVDRILKDLTGTIDTNLADQVLIAGRDAGLVTQAMIDEWHAAQPDAAQAGTDLSGSFNDGVLTGADAAQQAGNELANRLLAGTSAAIGNVVAATTQAKSAIAGAVNNVLDSFKQLPTKGVNYWKEFKDGLKEKPLTIEQLQHQIDMLDSPKGLGRIDSPQALAHWIQLRTTAQDQLDAMTLFSQNKSTIIANALPIALGTAATPTTDGMDDLLTIIQNYLGNGGTIPGVVNPSADAIGDALPEALHGSAGNLRDEMGNIYDFMHGEWVDLHADAVDWAELTGEAWFKKLAATVAGGQTTIENAIRKATRAFPAGSPPKEGPLHYIDVWARLTAQSWVDEYSATLERGQSKANAALGGYGALAGVSGPNSLMSGPTSQMDLRSTVVVRLEDPNGVAAGIGYTSAQASRDVATAASELVRNMRHSAAVAGNG